MSGFGALPAGVGRDALVAEVRGVLDEHLPPDTTVVLALSGGPDSTALAHLVTEARPDLAAVVGHVRHGLRDDAADAQVAAAHSAALGLDHHERRVQVDPAGAGTEAAAREARYGVLAAIGASVGARAVLTGHTADDQAETVLLNIARGTGMRGLAGMPVRRPLPPGKLSVIRPLLRLRRADVRRFVEEEGLVAVADPTNEDLSGRRNRTRHLLLPALGALAGGPGDPVGVLARLAALARQDTDLLEHLAQQRAAELVSRWGPTAAIPSSALRGEHPAIATRVVRAALEAVRGGLAGVGAEAVAAALTLPAGRSLDLGDEVRATSGGGWLAFGPARPKPLAEQPVRWPGTTQLAALGMVLHVDRPGGGQAPLPLPEEPTEPPPSPWAAPPGAGHPGWALLPELRDPVVRARRPGERIQLARGSRKLQDVFVDAGVPRALRPLVPVVADRSGTVWWVPGLALAATEEPRTVRVWLSPDPGRALGSPDPEGTGRDGQP